jgi:hypothetical protein
MVGCIAIGRAQVADQQLLATEDIEGQEAAPIVEAGEMPTELLTMHRVVCGVEVEDQALLRRPPKGADELLNDLFLDGHRPLTTGLLLEATQRRLAGQHSIGIDRGLQGDVAA